MYGCCSQIRYLGAIGGKDIAETTRRVLRSLMANSVAQQMNFVGRGQKRGIQQMRLLQVVIGKDAIHSFCVFTLMDVTIIILIITITITWLITLI